VLAAGGRVTIALDVYVRRLPPSARHFLGQRVRQAYDELARPRRCAVQLAILPALLMARRRPWCIAGTTLGIMALAEAGRRRSGGAAHFAAGSVLFAPAWLLERSICVWLALASQVLFGGIPYRGNIVPRAAHSLRELREQALGRAAHAAVNT
jgi:hypothetical protein